MKFNQFSAMTALVAGFAFVGCSQGAGEEPGQLEGRGDSTVGFKLRTPQGVVITSVSYDLDTSTGTDVLSGSIPVPNDNSVINGNLNALTAGSYSLDLSATGTYDGESVTCDAEPATFTLAASQDLVLSTPINLVCTIEVVTPDDTSSVTFEGNVTVQEVQVVRRVVESFGIAPISVRGVAGPNDSCTYPPMALTVANQNPAVTYAWTSSPDGTFSFSDATNTSGSYTCQSDGTKEVTVTATLDGVSASRTVSVTCASDCVNLCGNGTVDAGEQCDNAEPYCVACQIVPICGDTIVHAPEVCDPAGSTVPGGTCSADCRSIIPDEPVVCGDGVVEGDEVCDPPGSTVPGGTCNATCAGVDPVSTTQWDTCEACIRADVNLGPVQAEFCDADARCEAVQECAINNDCFSPVPGLCYCGITDITACEQAAFQPTGPCVAQIVAGSSTSGTEALPNAEVLTRFFAFEYPSGVGMAIINEAEQVCNAACFAP